MVIRHDWPEELCDAVRSTGIGVTEAARIIGGPLGKPGKMPCFTFGQDAFQCHRGGALADIAGTVCEGCYARKNFYKTYRPVLKNRQGHQAAIHHPRWCDAMVVLICKAAIETPYFRWFDSGDLESQKQLERIVEVASRTPHVKHWLATREVSMVKMYLAEHVKFPDNLVVRVSGDYVDDPPPLGFANTSTVHEHQEPHGFECRAEARGMYCGDCRACWSPGVRNVSYRKH